MTTETAASREYRAFQILQHWKATHSIIPAQELVAESDPAFSLFLFLYEKTNKLYETIPQRKNGEAAFIHPINVVLALKEAGISDATTLCAGLIHDYIEEQVDIHKTQKQLSEEGEDAVYLDAIEQQFLQILKQEVEEKSQEAGLTPKTTEEIIAITRLLTRKKRDFYYQSICNLFTCPEQELKEKAIQIKLADRMHNILSIENFSEQERIYTCFKNLFILNNTKKYLAEVRGKEVFSQELTPTERLFKRAAKATYDAFLRICEITTEKGIRDIRSMLHLAFRKFAWEKNGVLGVTELAKDELHLMRLYHQVIRKYDCRLRHKMREFRQIRDDEFSYCQRFFADFNFTDAQIQAILDYKDSYSLKEVIGMLLYVPDYVVKRFEYTDMFWEE
ncbi:hypothetical protein HYT55_05290 [Candidatus Woesearchaeota archaeon]|nr:hypothetical protein [Candidatus Woesearchaeota archaeon]